MLADVQTDAYNVNAPPPLGDAVFIRLHHTPVHHVDLQLTEGVQPEVESPRVLLDKVLHVVDDEHPGQPFFDEAGYTEDLTAQLQAAKEKFEAITAAGEEVAGPAEELGSAYEEAAKEDEDKAQKALHQL